MSPSPNIFPFSTTALPPPGDFVIADTNFLFNLMGRNNATAPFLQAECQNFVQTLAVNNISFATTIKTHEELRINMTYSMVGSGRKRKTAIASNPTALVPVVKAVAEIEKTLAGFSNYYPEPLGQIDAELLRGIDQLMSLGVQHGDAVIYLLSKREDINHIISLDGDFTLIADTNLTIYTSGDHYNRLIQSSKRGIALQKSSLGQAN